MKQYLNAPERVLLGKLIELPDRDSLTADERWGLQTIKRKLLESTGEVVCADPPPVTILSDSGKELVAWALKTMLRNYDDADWKEDAPFGSSREGAQSFLIDLLHGDDYHIPPTEPKQRNGMNPFRKWCIMEFCIAQEVSRYDSHLPHHSSAEAAHKELKRVLEEHHSERPDE